ncbi:helix-turn-helix domain-containing protein [Flexivirga meconopsidis]|uniref:winged helix-turn-helix transcriptional regulator n=1 Tax=Flexivirga meconopsidis TaxID=2977121 RepID=UPI0031344A7F
MNPRPAVLDRVGDKWTVLVVSALADGPMRFTALDDRIGGPSVPPHVEYELTDLGRSLREPIDVLRDWAEQHIASVVAHREGFDDVSA